MSDWLADAIAKETAYNEGYEAGKQAAAQQILDDLVDALVAKREEYKQNREANKAVEYPEATSYWLGRGLTCNDVLRLLTELKEKWGIQ